MIAEVEKLVTGGYGLCRTEEGVVFLPLVAPGDKVEIELVGKRKGVLWGEVKKVIAPSRKRQRPFCPHFPDCGGCQLQHLKYEAQLESKVEMVRDNFLRIGKVFLESIDTVSSPPVGYRTKVNIKVVDGRLGFFRRESNDLVEVERCFLLSHEAQQLFQKLKVFFKENYPFLSSVEEVVLLQNQDSTRFLIEFISSEEPEGLEEALDLDERIEGVGWGSKWFGRRELFYELKGFKYAFSTGSFIQSNRFLLEEMINTVQEWAGEGKIAADLYAGAGFFSLPLSEVYEEVVAVERSKEAERLFELNQQLNKVVNARFLRKRAEDFSLPHAELFVIDPPRGGINKKAFSKIVNSHPGRIIYFSCDSASAARDVRWFLQAGYSLVKVKIIDMFPQTSHIEVALLLEKKEGISIDLIG